jgi:hypothetical protein
MGAADWAELEPLAHHHGLFLLTGSCLDELTGTPLAVRQAFAIQAPGRRARQAVALTDLARLTSMLDDLPWALLKGPGLADHVWSRRGVREYSDLDVLVEPAAVPDLLAALESSGVRLSTRNWQYVYDGQWAEMSLKLWRGTALDLHWNVLGLPSRAPGVHFDTTAVLARTRSAVIGAGSSPITVPLPDPADMLLHVAVHALLEGLPTLRHVADLDQLLRHYPADDLEERAEATGAALMVAVALQRASAHSAAAARAANLARGSAWRQLMRINDLVSPIARSDRDLSLDFVAGSTRHTSFASLTTALRLGAHGVKVRRHPVPAGERPIWDFPVDDGYRARVMARLMAGTASV